MERIKFQCPGDCGNCELLASGKVQMEICVLDQIHQKVQRLDAKLDAIAEKITNQEILNQLASIDEQSEQ